MCVCVCVGGEISPEHCHRPGSGNWERAGDAADGQRPAGSMPVVQDNIYWETCSKPPRPLVNYRLAAEEAPGDYPGGAVEGDVIYRPPDGAIRAKTYRKS